MRTVRCLSAWQTIICMNSLVAALAVPSFARLNIRDEEPFYKSTRAIAGGVPLRIMPLGASITHGFGSSDGNGYRATLRQQLVSQGNPVNMVGSNPNGTMHDNENEDTVHQKSNDNVPKDKPNLVLINAGTNDAIQNVDIPNAGTRMKSMIDDIFKQSPQATIVLSTLIVNSNTATQARGVQINNQYKQLVTDLSNIGFPIVMADMQSSQGPTLSDLNTDGIHPTDKGYVKMAAIWLDAIGTAEKFIRKAMPVTGIPDDGGA